MKCLRRRLARLLRGSEIRLSASELRLDLLRTGDRLQIGPRLFRVERRPGDEESLDLVGPEPGRSRRARLRFDSSDPASPWVFEDRGTRIRLSSGDLLHFPVARSLAR